jgi:hypothetical protein
MKQKYYEWTVYSMFGQNPNEQDDWVECGSALTLKNALHDASKSLDKFKSRGFGLRYEVHKVKRKLVGTQVYLPDVARWRCEYRIPTEPST